MAASPGGAARLDAASSVGRSSVVSLEVFRKTPGRDSTKCTARRRAASPRIGWYQRWRAPASASVQRRRATLLIVWKRDAAGAAGLVQLLEIARVLRLREHGEVAGDQHGVERELPQALEVPHGRERAVARHADEAHQSGVPGADERLEGAARPQRLLLFLGVDEVV